MLFRKDPKPVQAYSAFVGLALDSFNLVWHDWSATVGAFSTMYPEASSKISFFSYQMGQRRYEIANAKARSVAVLIGLQNELLEELRGVLSTLELMDDFAQTTSAYTKVWATEGQLRLTTLQTDLDSLETLLRSLSSTQATVSEHTRVSMDEYEISAPAHPQIEEFHRGFYAELLNARDTYFEEASVENLRRYIAVAQELVEAENPLKAYAYSSSSIQHTVGADARAAALLDKLVRDELMVELLQDREELSHAE